MDYAMVLNGKVIEVIKNADIMPVYPPTILGDIITAVDCTGGVVSVGMTYLDGVFTASATPEPQESSLSEAEQTQLELALNVEYLTCLMELND